MASTERHLGETSRVLVIEGTSGIGKSTLADALVRRYVAASPPRKIRSLLHLTQAHTYGPLAHAEDAGTLTVAENRAHLDTLATLIEWHAHAVRGGQEPRFVAVIDTLHLTHTQRPGIVRWPDVARLDARLASMGARLLFLRGSAATLRRRGVDARRDEEFMTGYALPRFGPTPDDVCARFLYEQDQMAALVARSQMPSLIVDVDGDGLQGYLEDAFRFWLDPPMLPR